MSSSAPVPQSVRGKEPRFVAALVITVTVLSLATAILMGLNWSRGPYAMDSAIDVTAVTVSQRETLVIKADQPLSEKDPVTAAISPEGKTSAVVEGSNVRVSIEQPLRYDTSYTVTVRAAAASSNREGTLRAEFTTEKAEIVSLERNPDSAAEGPGRDSVVKRTLGEDQGFTVFSADKIQDVVVLDESVVVSTLDANSLSQLTYQPFQGADSRDVPVPTPGLITSLKSSGLTGLVGFLVAPVSQGSSALLYVTNPQADAPPTLVRAPDGTPMVVNAWNWVPNSTSLVVQDSEQMMWLIDYTGATAPEAIGRHTEFRGFVPGQDTFQVADPASSSFIDLKTGVKKEIAFGPAPLLPGEQQVESRFLFDRSTYVQIVATLVDISDKNPFTFSVRRVDGLEAVPILTPTVEKGVFRSLCVSPNSQYVAVVETPPDAEPGFYLGNPVFTGASTIIASAMTGEISQVVPGVFDAWCQ
jgi:hypothetical protein